MTRRQARRRAKLKRLGLKLLKGIGELIVYAVIVAGIMVITLVLYNWNF